MPDVVFDGTHAPTLRRFFLSDARVRACVGPFGSGKTSACVYEIPRRALQQRPGPDGWRRTRFVVVRNTYRELEDTTRRTFESWVPPTVGRWYESDFTFTMNWENKKEDLRVNSEVLFRALDRPEHINKVLSLELTGAYINEAREVPQRIFDGLRGRCGRYPAIKDGGPGWYGLWLDTNPWPTTHWGYKLFCRNKPPTGWELFEQPSGLSPEAENLAWLPGGRQYYEDLCIGADSEFIEQFVHAKYPASESGSYFGALLVALEQRGGLLAFEHELDGVFTTWDLGHADSTAIWFWRWNKYRLPDFIDHYEACGEPMSHYFHLLNQWAQERGYRYVKHCLPHDAANVTLQTGQSILDMCIEHFKSSSVEIVPRLPIKDRIAAARWLLEQNIRIHPRVSKLNGSADTDALECLRSYRKEYDEDLKDFRDKPVHDWSSHTSDAFQYAAVFVKIAEQNTRPKPPPPEVKVRTVGSFTLDELWEMDRQERVGNRNRIP